MIATIVILIVAASIALAWLFAWLGLPLWSWVGVAVIVYGILMAAHLMGLFGELLLGVPLAALLLFNLVPLRRELLTRPVFRLFRRVLPEMSATEREAIEAGEPWWEAQMFRGRPDWQQLLDFEYTRLKPEEQAFLAGPCETLCGMVDDWKVDFEDRDLPPQAWAYIREQRFFSMLIKKEYGGLEFSYAAQSAVVAKLATKSIALAVTVMVPNSLGPGELLQNYGTDAQRKQWLPRLADGSEIPCFGLTGPEVGSDATAMPDTGVVGYGEHEGRKVLGITLNFSKRWITLAPVATVVGLAFKLKDPEGLLGDRSKIDYGITCALVPAGHPGVEIGRRHYPGSAFMNGPIFGHDVFIPVEWIIGGPQKAGHGWRMLVECLSAGRGISLPALATAAGQTAYRSVGAFSRIRRQFKVAIGDFEGVQEATGRIAGLTYTLEAMRVMTASAVDHCVPSVVTAIAKYHMTEMMRQVLTDAMDVFSGRGVQNGPRNPLAIAYKAIPIAITVEGANILTRSLMIFGQGAMRCHQFVLPEMEAARNNDLKAFDGLLWAHVGTVINRAVRAFTHGLTGAAFAHAPKDGATAPYFKQLERMSASLSFVADVTLGVLGGDLKRRERLSARLGDVLSQLYIASCVLKYYLANGEQDDDLPHMRWALDRCLARIGVAFDGYLRNFPNRGVAALLRWVVFPLGNPYRPVSDALNGEIASMMMQPTALRERLCHLVYVNGGEKDPVGRLEHTFRLLLKAEAPYLKFHEAQSRSELSGDSAEALIADAVAKGVIDEGEARLVAEYDAARLEAIQTDDFSKAYIAGDHAETGAQADVPASSLRVA